MVRTRAERFWWRFVMIWRLDTHGKDHKRKRFGCFWASYVMLKLQITLTKAYFPSYFFSCLYCYGWLLLCGFMYFVAITIQNESFNLTVNNHKAYFLRILERSSTRWNAMFGAVLIRQGVFQHHLSLGVLCMERDTALEAIEVLFDVRDRKSMVTVVVVHNELTQNWHTRIIMMRIVDIAVNQNRNQFKFSYLFYYFENLLKRLWNCSETFACNYQLIIELEWQIFPYIFSIPNLHATFSNKFTRSWIISWLYSLYVWLSSLKFGINHKLCQILTS